MSGIFAGIMIPFIGTTAGAACVFFLKNALKPRVQKAFLGFASGVMVAASVWSLLFPSMDIISLPLKEAAGKGKAFIYGTLSGVVEPIGAVLMLVLAEFLGPVLPYFLSFAAGAMIYVVVEELIPESAEGEHSNVATIGFAVGFVVMMILDVALG